MLSINEMLIVNDGRNEVMHALEANMIMGECAMACDINSLEITKLPLGTCVMTSLALDGIKIQIFE